MKKSVKSKELSAVTPLRHDAQSHTRSNEDEMVRDGSSLSLCPDRSFPLSLDWRK